ncbi:MAG: NAD-dependent DNA ligase LigA, partial [Nitrospirae bacterium]|nr:NAD-dependent DNA ligase LigA [Nitrospirota bacterium]
ATKIIEIKQMGEKGADSISAFFADPVNIKTLEELKKLGVVITNPDYDRDTQSHDLHLKGLTFVITGSLPMPRKEVEQMIEKLGGHAASSVSKNTDYLIVGENPGSKLQIARSLGVKTINFTELLKLLNRDSLFPI